MKHNDLVSIIVPVYNAEKYINECIESILLQTYDNIEVLLVNDGSEDRSGKICEEYAARDSRIKIVHQDNMGPSVARNNGIDQSEGAFLQFVDADDQLDNLMVEKLVSYKTGVDLVLCGYKSVVRMDQDSFVEKFNPPNKGYYSLNEFMQIFTDLFKKKLINSPCNKLYDANIVKNNNLNFDIGIHNGEDLLFNIKYLKFCRKIKIVDEPLYYYIKFNNTSSLTKKYKNRFFENRKKIFNELNELLINYRDIAPENCELIKEISTDYLLLSLSNIYNDNVNLSWKTRKMELNSIIKSNWVRENMSNFTVNTLQEKLVIFLVRHQSYIGINLYFTTKTILRKKANKPFKFLKRFN